MDSVKAIIRESGEIKSNNATSVLNRVKINLQNLKLGKALAIVDRLLQYHDIPGQLSVRTFNGKVPTRMNVEHPAKLIPEFEGDEKLNLDIFTQLKNKLVSLVIWNRNGGASTITTEETLPESIRAEITTLFKDVCDLAGVESIPRLYTFSGQLSITELEYNDIISKAYSRIKQFGDLSRASISDPKVQQIISFYELINFDEILAKTCPLIKIADGTSGKMDITTNKYSHVDEQMAAQVFETSENQQAKEDADKLTSNLFLNWFQAIQRDTNSNLPGYRNYQYLSTEDLNLTIAAVHKLYETDEKLTEIDGVGQEITISFRAILDNYGNTYTVDQQISHICEFLKRKSNLQPSIVDAISSAFEDYGHAVNHYKNTRRYGQIGTDRAMSRKYDMRVKFLEHLKSHAKNTTVEVLPDGEVKTHSTDTERSQKITLKAQMVNAVLKNVENGAWYTLYSPYFLYDDLHKVGDTDQVLDNSFIQWFQEAFGINLDDRISDFTTQELLTSLVRFASKLSMAVHEAVSGTIGTELLDSRIQGVVNDAHKTMGSDWVVVTNLLVADSSDYKHKLLAYNGNIIPANVLPSLSNQHDKRAMELPEAVRKANYLINVNHKVVCKIDQNVDEENSVHANELTLKGLIHNNVGTYFFRNLVDNHTFAIQPYDASDKARQMMDQVALNDGEYLMTTDGLQSAIYNQHKAYYEDIADKIIVKYKQIFPKLEEGSSKFQTLLNIQKLLDQTTGQEFDSLLEAAYKTNPGFQWIKEVDYVKQSGDKKTGKGSIALNASLVYMIQLAEDKRLFTQYLEEQIKTFKKELDNEVVVYNCPRGYLETNKEKILQLFNIQSTIKNQKFKDDRIVLKWTDSPKTLNEEVANAIIQNYAYYSKLVVDADMILVAQSPVTYGKSSGRVDYNLLSTSKDLALRAQKEISTRYVASTKRGNINVATITPYTSTSADIKGDWHISRNMRIAAIQSLKRNLQNYQGDRNEGQAVWDGECLSNGIWSQFEQESLANGKKNTGSKKMLSFGYSQAGVTQIKCADYELNNALIRAGGYSASQGNHIVANSKGMFKQSLADCQFQGLTENDVKLLSGKYKRSYGIQVDRNGSKHMVSEITYINESTIQIHYKEIGTNNESSENVSDLYSLWEALGGEWSMDSDGNLDEGSMKVCAAFVVECMPQLKERMIAKMVIEDSIKSGVVNINPEKAWEGNTPLRSFTVTTDYTGIQNDNSHEADESEVASPNQVISAVAFNGINVVRSSEMYDAFASYIKQKSDIGISGDTKPVLHKLAKELLRSLDTANDISSARSIVEKILDEATKEGIQFSISNSDLFYKTVSNILSTLTHKTLKPKFHGVAAVMNPSYNRFRMYTIPINGRMETVTAEDLYRIANEKRIQGNTPQEKIQNYLTTLQSGAAINNPIQSIADVHIGDNVIVNGNPVYIENPQQMLELKNQMLNGASVTLDFTKPRDLRPVNITYKVDGSYENFWCAEIVQTLSTMKKGDREYAQALQQYRGLLKALSQAKQSGIATYNGHTITSVNVEAGEQVLPKVNRTAHKLGNKTLYQARTDGTLVTAAQDILDIDTSWISQTGYSYISAKLGKKTVSLYKGKLDPNLKTYTAELDIDGSPKFFLEDGTTIDAVSEDSVLMQVSADEFVMQIPANSQKAVKKWAKKQDGGAFYYKNQHGDVDYSYISEYNDILPDEVSNIDTKEANEDAFLTAFTEQIITSFDVSNDSVSLRIPSQSYQSFMGMRTVAFINENTNDCYTNIWQIWFQGSDFDIDKNYTVMFELDSVGRVANWSPLFNYKNRETLHQSMEIIPLPNADKVIRNSATDTITAFIQDFNTKNDPTKVPSHIWYGRLLRAINSSKTDLTFDQHTSREVMNIVATVNKHQLYAPSGGALKNKILKVIYDSSLDPENLEHSTQPMSSKPFQEVLSKLDEVVPMDSSVMDPTNPMSIFKQIRRNSIGKKCVGVFANGIKVNGALQQYYNRAALEGKFDQYKQFEIKELKFVIPNATEIHKKFPNVKGYDSKTGTLTISKQNIKYFANLNLTDDVLMSLLNNDSKKVAQAKQLLSQEENVADQLSILISLATDNAKELALARMNVTEDVAKGMVTMFYLGFSVEEALLVYRCCMDEVVSELETNPFMSQGFKPNPTNLIKNSKKLDDNTKNSLVMVFKVGDEITELARFFKINRGIPATFSSAMDFFNGLKRFKGGFKKNPFDTNGGIDEQNDFIRRYDLGSINTNNISNWCLAEFDINQFGTNEEYQRVMVALCQENKTAINVFDVILNSPTYMEMLNAFNSCITDMGKLSGAVAFSTSSVSSQTSAYAGQQIAPVTHSQKIRMWSDFVVGEHLKRLSSRFKFSQTMLSDFADAHKIDGLRGIIPQNASFSLGTETGVNRFVMMMDAYISKYLIPKYKDKNKFISKLSKTTVVGKPGRTVYDIQIQSLDFDSRYMAAEMDGLRSAFANICKVDSGLRTVSGEVVTIGELFYLYSKITSKNSIGKMGAVMDYFDAVSGKDYQEQLNNLYVEFDEKYANRDNQPSEEARRRQQFSDLFQQLQAGLSDDGVEVKSTDGKNYFKIPRSAWFYSFGTKFKTETLTDAELNTILKNIESEYSVTIKQEGCI